MKSSKLLINNDRVQDRFFLVVTKISFFSNLQQTTVRALFKHPNPKRQSALFTADKVEFLKMEQRKRPSSINSESSNDSPASRKHKSLNVEYKDLKEILPPASIHQKEERSSHTSAPFISVKAQNILNLKSEHKNKQSNRFHQIIDIESALDALLTDADISEEDQIKEILYYNETKVAKDENHTLTKGMKKSLDDRKSILRKKKTIQAHYRRGQVGDSATLASLIRKQKTQHSQVEVDEKCNANVAIKDSNYSNNNEDNASLELMLANGFGDEHTPPAFYAILVEVCVVEETFEYDLSESKMACDDEAKIDLSEKDTTSIFVKSNLRNRNTNKGPTSIVGASMLCLEWDAHQSARIMKNEFFHIDNFSIHNVITTLLHDSKNSRLASSLSSLLARRFMLRMATLALSTGCQFLRFEQKNGFPSALLMTNDDQSDMNRNP